MESSIAQVVPEACNAIGIRVESFIAVFWRRNRVSPSNIDARCIGFAIWGPPEI